MGGEGAAKLWFLSRPSTAAGTTLGVFPLHPIKSPYLPLWSIFYTPWLPNFILVKISLNVQFVFLKVSQVSKLGARGGGPSFHLLGHPPLSLHNPLFLCRLSATKITWSSSCFFFPILPLVLAPFTQVPKILFFLKHLHWLLLLPGVLFPYSHMSLSPSLV